MFSAISGEFQTFIKAFMSLVGSLLGHPTYSGLKEVSLYALLF